MEAANAALGRLVEQVQDARRRGTCLDIVGGGTKRFYGEAPRGESLDLRPLTGISSYEPTELVVTARGGTPLQDLEATLAERGQYLPFEPPRFAPLGTVGGMVAAGLSGPARGTVGPLRDFVLGITTLNGNGELLSFGGQVMKNVAGYDVSRVFAGSMGILGVICEVSLKVMPVPAATRTIVLECTQAAALRELNRWAGQAFPMHASAWVDGRLRIRLAGARAAVGRAVGTLEGVELDASSATEWWASVRDHHHEFFQLSAAELEAGLCLWRIAVPDTAPPLGLSGPEFVEWGGAQRWLRTDMPAERVRAAAAAAGGHATLMRAIDKSPGVFTRLSAAVMTIQQRLKASFDPAGVFNPGRLYPDL